MRYTTSIIFPIERAEIGNLILEQVLLAGPETVSVPLYDPEGIATYLGGCANSAVSYEAALPSLTGTVNWEAFGLTLEEVTGLLRRPFIASEEKSRPQKELFSEMCRQLGVTLLEPTPEETD